MSVNEKARSSHNLLALDDRELVRRICRKDQRALGVAYDRHAPLIYSLSLRILGVESDAEEILQDVFLQLWAKAATIDESRGTLTAWLVTVTRSRAIDRLRARRARLQPSPENFVPLEDALLDEKTAQEEATLLSRENAPRVRRALNDLPASQRLLLELAFFEGLTHSEIASQLGEPLGTVKTRIRGGLLKLRELLAPLMGSELSTEESEPSSCDKKN